MNDKKCKNCSLFPCTLENCDIHNEQGCRDFESTVQKELKESLITIEKNISKLPIYKRQPCINCDYKLICVGECKKTINRGGLAYGR